MRVFNYEIIFGRNSYHKGKFRVYRDSNSWSLNGLGLRFFIGRPEWCEECGESYYEHGCQECCDHEPDADEGFHCLLCGKDCSESVMSRAYDRAKDFRKYGE